MRFTRPGSLGREAERAERSRARVGAATEPESSRPSVRRVRRRAHPRLAGWVEREFVEFVADPRFPCLAGKAVVQRRNYGLGIYGELGARDSAAFLARDLAAFGRAPRPETELRSFAAVFTSPVELSEDEFEAALWRQLQRLNDRDDPSVGWDPSVASDPDDPAFSFSFDGTAYFVVGMHPGSSRLARRFRWPTLVFNPHAQFELLRERGQFEPLKSAIRERDAALQGDINPNLADHGEISEARQYSGRRTEPGWKCPFHRRR
jgi:uncharacterized protein